MKKKILFAYPSSRDMRELAHLKNKIPYELVIDTCSHYQLEDAIGRAKSEHSVSRLIDTSIAQRLNDCMSHRVDGVISSLDYPSSILAAIVAGQLGLPGPDRQILLQLHHKYYARQLQKKIMPEAIPAFELIPFCGTSIDQLCLEYPFFIKPVKSYRSMGAYIIYTKRHLAQTLKALTFPRMFLEPFNHLLRRYCALEHDAHHMIGESLLSGVQVTLEGFVFQGEITIMGITDSVMHPGTINFERFEYPSRLPETVQKRMRDITTKLILGIGLDNTMFNIEFMYDAAADKISIIELNPRMAYQFADLYEKVDGTNGYQILLDIAAGNKPTFTAGNGPYNFAASCVMRAFENKRVVAVPSQEEIKQIEAQFPEMRIELLAQPGETLDQYLQDASSFRYAIINLGGDDRDDLLQRYEKCKRKLDITLAPIVLL